MGEAAGMEGRSYASAAAFLVSAAALDLLALELGNSPCYVQAPILLSHAVCTRMNLGRGIAPTDEFLTAQQVTLGPDGWWAWSSHGYLLWYPADCHTYQHKLHWVHSLQVSWAVSARHYLACGAGRVHTLFSVRCSCLQFMHVCVVSHCLASHIAISLTTAGQIG